MTKPKILLLCDHPSWAFDYDAREISKHLADHFSFEIAYAKGESPIDEDDYDLIWVFWWRAASKTVRKYTLENREGNQRP